MIDVKIDIAAALESLSRVAAASQKTDAIRRGVNESLAPAIAAMRSIVQQPGKPGYFTRYGKRKRLKHLRDTIGHATRIYDKAVVGVAGPQMPAGAAGHLVEFGHRVARGGTLVRTKTAPLRWKEGGRGRRPKRAFLRGSTPLSKKGPTGGGKIVGQTRAFPFISTAWAATGKVAERTMIDAVRKHVEAAAAAGSND
jgi:hypothetical protein